MLPLLGANAIPIRPRPGSVLRPVPEPSQWQTGPVMCVLSSRVQCAPSSVVR